MSTTIQIKEPTKRALFIAKNRLELLYGRSLSYDDVIDFLIRSCQLEKIGKRSFDQFQGLLGDDGRKIYEELRKESLANEE